MKRAEQELAQRQLAAASATPRQVGAVGGLLPRLPPSWLGGSRLGDRVQAVRLPLGIPSGGQ